jgi:predicted DNA-binding antitoxin AbrB/MazE fold protein
MSEKPSVTLPGTVDRIMDSGDPSEAAKAHITIEKGAAPLYREIRIENTLIKEDGKKVKLRTGATVEVTVRANSSEVVPSLKKRGVRCRLHQARTIARMT